MSSNNKCSIALVLQGGGARGAYQVGVIKAFAEMNEQKAIPFRVLCGTSVGALNAAALAAGATDFGKSARKLESIWRRLTSKSIYNTRLSHLMRSAIANTLSSKELVLLDNTPFRGLLTHTLANANVADVIRSGALDALCVTASSYNIGRAVTFYEASDNIPDWHRVRRVGVRASIGVEHLMASSALPFLFPSVCIDGNHYGDGALRSRSPLSPAIRMGASGILAIGVRNLESERKPVMSNTTITPSLGVIGGNLLDIIFNDSLDADIERLGRINETLRLLPQASAQKTTLKSIDVLTLNPSQDIRVIAEAYREELPRSMRFLLRSIGEADGHGQLLSYLLFEPGFISALIELGYADAMAKREEINAILSGESPYAQ